MFTCKSSHIQCHLIRCIYTHNSWLLNYCCKQCVLQIYYQLNLTFLDKNLPHNLCSHPSIKDDCECFHSSNIPLSRTSTFLTSSCPNFFPTYPATKGVPIETIGQMMGHKSIKTTQIYAKIIDKKIADDMNDFSNQLPEFKVKAS